MNQQKKKNVLIDQDYLDPEKSEFEIVERKGMGHPDTLADGLANYVSIKYSQYCLDNFGVVLHHNLDKVYVGGGIIEKDFGKAVYRKPISVMINGRASDMFGDKKINLRIIFENAVKEYLKMILPTLDLEKGVKVTVNCTQFAEPGEFWYRPKDINDLPEYQKLMANDTSICVAHAPKTLTEELTYELEQYFWTRKKDSMSPKFLDYGQDIKVMSVREGKNLDITLCVPVIMTKINNWEEYGIKLESIEEKLQKEAEEIVQDKASVVVRVNPGQKEKFRKYTLSVGTCAEVGEEGIVGRGNAGNGIISVLRPHTMEAPAGKNPKYHTGRVLGYLTQKMADTINKEFGVKVTVLTMTKNYHSLIPPYLTRISLSEKVEENRLNELINEVYNSDYLKEIIENKIIA